MIKYFNDDFKFGTVSELNTFILKVVRIAEAYISYQVVKGKTYLPFDLSYRDAAIDVCADIFETNKLQLVKFHKHFKNNSYNINSDKDAETALKSYIYGIVQNNIIELYRENDPLTYKIMRNIKEAAHNEDYFFTQLISGKYLHRSPVDFNFDYIDREELLGRIMSDKLHININNFGSFLNVVFENLESQNKYIHSVSLNDLVWIYKEIYLHNFYSRQGIEDRIDENIHIKILLENSKRKHALKLKNYLKKINFSEEDALRMYNIVEDVIESLNSGGKKKSVRRLVDEYFSGRSGDGIFNKVEYVLKLFTDELIISINEGEAKIG